MRLEAEKVIKKRVYSVSNDDRKKINGALDMLKELSDTTWKDCDNVDNLTLMTEEYNYSYEEFSEMLVFLQWIADGNNLAVEEERKLALQSLE